MLWREQQDQRWDLNGLDVSTRPDLWLVGTLWEEHGKVVEDTAMEPNYLSLNSRLLQPLDTTLTSSRLLFLHI